MVAAHGGLRSWLGVEGDALGSRRGLEERKWNLEQKWRPGMRSSIFEDAKARPGEVRSPGRKYLFLIFTAPL